MKTSICVNLIAIGIVYSIISHEQGPYTLMDHVKVEILIHLLMFWQKEQRERARRK